MAKELFICGDPRYLSGGGYKAISTNYNNKIVPLQKEVRVTSLEIEKAYGNIAIQINNAISAVSSQMIHQGQFNYHHRPALNMFLEAGQSPSVGVEIETEERRDINKDLMLKELNSNWFHFERDASLHTGTRMGYELITEPLPPRIYRNPRLWAGLQNLLTPWVESYAFPQTGLHVHVGIDMFETCDKLPVTSSEERRLLGKYMVAFLYYTLLPRSFIDKVMLRSNTAYCAQTTNPDIDKIKTLIYSSKFFTGQQFINAIMEALLSSNEALYFATIEDAANYRDLNHEYNPKLIQGHLSDFTGHNVEINMAPSFTIEFRRGKGTLHSLSIHRMVELASLVVRYAWRIARNPSLPVSKHEILSFIERSTVNEALRNMAHEAQINKIN